jgi:leader peptidase (prepilin peptidase)/N-methyltransferase
MAVLIMAIAGVLAGFALDAAIARLSREPYERVEPEGDAHSPLEEESPHRLELSSEAGALAMPRALTSAAMYRRAVVVGATAIVFGIIGLRYESDALHMLIIAAYASALIVCTGTDLLAYRVPNVVTYPAIVAAITIGLVMPDANPANVLAGGALVGGTFLLMSILTRGGMGMGDVKLAAFTGFALGLELGVAAMLLTAIGGGIIAVVLLVTRVRDRRDPIPYAPFIAAGALYVLLAQGAAFVEL